jgi:hypothetical protein
MSVYHQSRAGKDQSSYNTMKSTEFLSAKRIEEEALMAALGMKSMPPPANPISSAQNTPVIKREPQSIKNEPMTPAIHNDPRNSKRHHQNKNYHEQRKEDRRRRRQLKATASDEEKNEWSENDEDDLMDEEYDDEAKMKHSNQKKKKKNINVNVPLHQHHPQLLNQKKKKKKRKRNLNIRKNILIKKLVFLPVCFVRHFCICTSGHRSDIYA